ncbi:Rid family hydrolase [Acinetobacter baylyi]|uniref:Rid family hydrolase n=1 Tax=Acinetobacter baylyi TaxID=202950 RepID=UPI000EA25171|nr:Rid family hydrolase [Acinetobacter baylyi]
MAKIIKATTGSVLEKQASYSRVVAVNNWIYVSNTAGRNPDTKQIPEDLKAQTLQVFTNVERALKAVGSSLNDVIFSTVYVQDPKDIPAVMDIVGEKFRGINPATSVTCPPLGSLSYKMELEVKAYRGAGTSEVEEILIT